MPYGMKPLSCDPARVKGMSERLIMAARQFWRSICTNTPIKWTLAPKPAATSTVLWR